MPRLEDASAAHPIGLPINRDLPTDGHVGDVAARIAALTKQMAEIDTRLDRVGARVFGQRLGGVAEIRQDGPRPVSSGTLGQVHEALVSLQVAIEALTATAQRLEEL